MLRRAFKIVRTMAGYCLAALVIWALLLDGVAARYAYTQHPADIHRYNSASKTAVVYFAGVQSSGRAHSAPLRDLWTKHGDVIVVEYNPQRFDGRVTVYDVHSRLIEWGYERALLIGASMGGLLATDLIDLDRATGSHLKFAVMMQDVPQSKSDLRDSAQADAVARMLYPGPLDNWLFTDLVWHFAFKPPPHYMLGKGVNQGQLAEHYHASSNYPLSGWAGQIRYIVRHRGYERNQYVGIPLVVMQSQNDGVVKPTADLWRPIFGGGTVIAVPETTHIGFVEYPQRWQAAFTQGFAVLPGW